MTEAYSRRLRDDRRRGGAGAGGRDRARRLRRPPRAELRDARRDPVPPHDRRRRRRHVDGARGDRRPAHGSRGARHLVHHQRGRRASCRSRWTMTKSWRWRAGSAACSRRCWRASLCGSDDRRPKGSPPRQGDEGPGAGRPNDGAWEPVAIDAASAGDSDEAPLLAAAVERANARGRASPTSRSAPRSKPADGSFVTGCNIENATYGLTMCAERVALFKALSDGRQAFTPHRGRGRHGGADAAVRACRQLLWEFCGDIEVILASTSTVTAPAPAVAAAAAAVRRPPAGIADRSAAAGADRPGTALGAK